MSFSNSRSEVNLNTNQVNYLINDSELANYINNYMKKSSLLDKKLFRQLFAFMGKKTISDRNLIVTLINYELTLKNDLEAIIYNHS